MAQNSKKKDQTGFNPKEIASHVDDDALDLSMCNLDEVPVKDIVPIRKINTLDLSNNILTSLPKNFITLTQIVKLDLSKNLLTEIPENFGEMRQLKHLDLYSNQISRLPLSLGDLKNLKWLDLKENPLTPAVASVAGQCSNNAECLACARNVVAYLSSVRESVDQEKQRRLNEQPATNDDDKEQKKDKKKKKKPGKKKAADPAPAANKNQTNSINKKAVKVKVDEKPKGNKNASKGGLCSVLLHSFISVVVWVLILGILVALAICLYPLYDKHRSTEFFKYIEQQTKVPVGRYRELGLEVAKQVMHSANDASEKAQVLIKQTYFHYFGNESTGSSDEL